MKTKVRWIIGGAILATLAYTAAIPSAVLVIFLPGIGDLAEDFESRGFIEALMQSPLRADAMAVDAHYGYYGRRTLLERLAQDVVLPARSRYREVWLVGISVGGPDHIGRALLLAPYLGETEWMWRWIRDQPAHPRLYLGYGSRDRFAAANALFAGHLPPDDQRAVFEWVSLNAAALVAYWEGRIDTIELGRLLKRIPSQQPGALSTP